MRKFKYILKTFLKKCNKIVTKIKKDIEKEQELLNIEGKKHDN